MKGKLLFNKFSQRYLSCHNPKCLVIKPSGMACNQNAVGFIKETDENFFSLDKFEPVCEYHRQLILSEGKIQEIQIQETEVDDFDVTPTARTEVF